LNGRPLCDIVFVGLFKSWSSVIRSYFLERRPSVCAPLCVFQL
jgi:hypothetical protein